MTNDKKQEQEEPITIAKEDVLETFDKAGDPLAMWCILRGRGKPVNHHTDAEYDALQSQLADAKAKLDALETAKSVSAITHILEGEHIQEWNELEAENESLKAKLDMATIIIDEFHDRLGVPGEESYLLELTRDLGSSTSRSAPPPSRRPIQTSPPRKRSPKRGTARRRRPRRCPKKSVSMDTVNEKS